LSIKQNLIKGSSVSFFLSIVGKFLGLALQMLLARCLVVSDYGVFSYVLAAVEVLVVLTLVGLPTYILRNISFYFPKKEWSKIRGVLYISNRINALVSLLVIIVAESLLWLDVFDLDSALKPVFQIGLLLVFFLGLTRIRQQAFLGLKKVFAAKFLELILTPVLMISGLGVLYLLAGQSDVQSVILLRLGAVVSTLGVATLTLNHFLPSGTGKSERQYNISEVLSISSPMVIAQVIRLGIGQLSILLLGYLALMSDVGVYNISFMFSNLALLGLTSLNTIAAPMISNAYSENNKSDMQKITAAVTLGSSAYAVLLCFILLVFGKQLLGFVGAQYQGGYFPMLILSVGQLVNGMCGPVGFLLTMTKYQKRFAQILFFSGLVNIFFCTLLIPGLGITGAAIASMSSNIAWNLIAVFFVKRKLKLSVFLLDPGVFNNIGVGVSEMKRLIRSKL
jgi:O-antigen/teichoic acid export membrane protein